jgi:hypothetical protein
MEYMKIYNYIRILFFISTAWGLSAQPGQIDVSRIEMMPNEPAPYNVRDWKQVAIQYDSFVYDIQKTGQYLPLVSLQGPAFGLHTYVGTNNTNGREAINILPSLVGASLVGVDKSNHYGQNWVLRSQDFFNDNSGELIYLNNPGGGSGNDWWYETMPNVFFYQLYDLYPNLGGDEAFQFVSVADRFLEAVRAMGGSDTPWQQAYMNYRAWDFSDMQPLDEGVTEPEAAGAFAWILYHAWKRTGNPEYLKGAEWSMEFLDGWNTNPSYEIQLPYGIYAAAKMNAELNTDYDVEKMVNWAFDRGAIRGWGAIVGEWSGFDVHGLIGEANDNGNDYAFQMNGIQQAAALAPMLRYDKRFARAIGKWMLNLANATRLFYPGFLPDFLQDASDWSNQYDPQRVVGYEALREQWEGKSPFSTGDALRGGWAATNLALYGTSSIGYLGAIFEETNDRKIFKIDLLKTDFFGDEAYPTYLFFNPYNTSKTIELSVGMEDVDIYEMLSETFIMQNVNGEVSITIPADEAIIVTLTPPNGEVTYEKNRMLVDGIIVDYMQTTQPFQYAPRIQSLMAAAIQVEEGDSTTIFAKAFDQDSPNLNYEWSTEGGSISGSGTAVKWLSPASSGEYEVMLIVGDDTDQKDTATITINVVAEINVAPQIESLQKGDGVVDPNETIALQVTAIDENGDSLTYEWTASSGSISGSGSTVNWTAPAAESVAQITITVTDEGGLSDSETTTIWVKTFAPTQGNLIAWYPFNFNGDDISGNELDGQVSGAIYTEDAFGNPSSALLTDGINDKVTVENNALLNVQDAITVSCWFEAKELPPNKEVFLLSHGSWQNRWKVSVIEGEKIRWTVNTINGIGDLDSEAIQADSLYHLTVTYDKEWMIIYLNGTLQTFRPLSGPIRTTALPFLMAQMLPDNNEFNYKGVLDEVKIFDYALSPEAVASMYNELTTSVHTRFKITSQLRLSPNPATEFLTISFTDDFAGEGLLSVFDLQGRQLVNQKLNSKASLNMEVKDWHPGVYQLVLRTRQGISTARFVKLQ